MQVTSGLEHSRLLYRLPYWQPRHAGTSVRFGNHCTSPRAGSADTLNEDTQAVVPVRPAGRPLCLPPALREAMSSACPIPSRPWTGLEMGSWSVPCMLPSREKLRGTKEVKPGTAGRIVAPK